MRIGKRPADSGEGGLRERLIEIHSALDRGLGDSDIEWMEEDEMRDEVPIQWAAMQLAREIDARQPTPERGVRD